MKAYYHLPGLFEFYDLYRVFLPLFREHREFFFDWCEIGSVYGAPADCLWGGGRVGFGDADPADVAALMREYGISARLTFSNSLLEEKHLNDKKCNKLCELFQYNAGNPDGAHNAVCDSGVRIDCDTDNSEHVRNGIVIYSDLLMAHIRRNYPGFYFISSTTKVLTDFENFRKELDREEFEYVVPDFRLNKEFDKLNGLSEVQKNKVEFLCNECCDFNCHDRKNCYENVSRKSLGEECEDHICVSPNASRGYRFSEAMNNPGYIGPSDICDIYMPMGFSNFKLEGRSLGSAVVFEFLLHYMTKPEYRLKVREEVYLDSMLDLF
jgi:hypothetical protein